MIENSEELLGEIVSQGQVVASMIATKGAKGDKGDTGNQGIPGVSPIVTTSKSGKETTITIVDIEGTKTATINDGLDGSDGQDGEDGYSPSASVTKVGKIATITITDENGTTTTEIRDGEDGQGSGDMLKVTYDTNNNGIVDNAEKVNNHTVDKDVPSTAIFTDENAVWGNITGTITNQTDLKKVLGTKVDILASRLSDATVGTSTNPYILDEMTPGYYFIDTPSGTTYTYFKLTSSLTSTLRINNTAGQGYGFYIYIPEEINYDSLTEGDTLFYIDKTTIGSTGSVSKSTTCYVYATANNSKIASDSAKSYNFGYGTSVVSGAQTWNGVKTFNSVPVCSTAPTNDEDLANKKYVDDSIPDVSNFIETSSTSGLVKNDGTIDTTSYSTFSGSYTDLSNKPTIPTNTSDLTNDSNFAVTNADNKFSVGQTISGETVVDGIRTKNMIDTESFIQGYISNTGVFNSNAVYALFTYIPVKPSTTYTIHTSRSIYSVGINEYSSSKTWISRAMEYNITDKTFTTGSTTYFVRVFINYDNSTSIGLAVINNINPQFEEGSSFTNNSKYVPIDVSTYDLFNNRIGSFYGIEKSTSTNTSIEINLDRIADRCVLLVFGVTNGFKNIFSIIITRSSDSNTTVQNLGETILSATRSGNVITISGFTTYSNVEVLSTKQIS